MNILMVTSDHQMIDRRIIQEARSLLKKGYRVKLLAGFECEKSQRYQLDGICIERFEYEWTDKRLTFLASRLRIKDGSFLFKYLVLLFRFWAKYISGKNSYEYFVYKKIVREDFDLLHAHDFPMLKPAAMAAKKLNKPMIYDAHEIYYAQIQLPKKIQKKYKRIEKKWIRYPDQVITVNPFIAKLMSERYGIEEPNVILNASEVEEVCPTGKIRSRFGISEDTKIVIYQGWISDNRGIEYLVDAVTDFAEDVVLVLIGYGFFVDTLKQRAKELGVSDRVYFYGQVDPEEMLELTAEASIGVIPYFGVDDNNYYCSPNKLFEFVMAGTPLICNKLPFLERVLDKYGCGITCDLKNSAELSFVIGKALDPKRLERLKVGVANARKELNWSVEEQKLFSIYANVV